MGSQMRLAWTCGWFLVVSQVQAAGLWHGKDAYLGESPPGDTPVVFAPGRLAEPGMFTMGRVAFSRDGREFYFTQNDSWKSGAHASLRMLRFERGRWSGPRVVATQSVSPTLSMDGQKLFMRKGGLGSIWVSERRGMAWGEPVLYLEDAPGLYDFMPTESGRLYVGSEPDAPSKAQGTTFAIGLLTLEPELAVRALGSPPNGRGFNGDFFIAPDESYMVLSANVTADFESEAYISFRDSTGGWTQPVSLGSKINDGPAHRWGYFVPRSGDYLFYSQGTSERDCAIRWVRFAELRQRLMPG